MGLPLKTKDVYKLYCDLIPKKKTFLRYVKGKKDVKYEDWVIDIVCKEYEVSKFEAKDYLNIFYLTSEGKLNLKGIIENGNMALQELTSIASTSESPRAFEVVAQMVKNLADVNKDLLEIQKKLKVLKDGEQKDPKNVTNALFVGSTAELQKIIKGEK
jgi:uncharacterized protein YeeX (DUF496 family)